MEGERERGNEGTRVFIAYLKCKYCLWYKMFQAIISRQLTK